MGSQRLQVGRSRDRRSHVVFHKADEPDFIAYFLDADVLASEDGAEVDLSAADADAAALRDACTVLIAGIEMSLWSRLRFSRILGAPQLGRSRLS
jgi:hypothetical protein